MSKVILQTERLRLREFTADDFFLLAAILQDPAVMYAYEHDFTNGDVQEWLDKQLARYARDGFGLWAVELNQNGTFIGQCGLTRQNADGAEVVEIGYLFLKAYWHNGYAAEAAAACKEYAFKDLNLSEVYSIIKHDNALSQNVAKQIGMTERKRFIKHYKGKNMPHILYSVKA